MNNDNITFEKIQMKIIKSFMYIDNRINFEN